MPIRVMDRHPTTSARWLHREQKPVHDHFPLPFRVMARLFGEIMVTLRRSQATLHIGNLGSVSPPSTENIHRTKKRVQRIFSVDGSWRNLRWLVCDIANVSPSITQKDLVPSIHPKELCHPFIPKDKENCHGRTLAADGAMGLR